MLQFFKSLTIFLFAVLLQSCSSEDGGDRGAYRIAVDPNWYPVNFQDKISFVAGFTDDLLLEISRVGGLRFEKVSSNWDTLFSGLKKKDYDGVLSVLAPYNFNRAQYDFSGDFLEIGPVLITAPKAKFHKLSEMNMKIVGILSGSRDIMIIQKYPQVLIRMFDTSPEMLAELEKGSIDGVVAERILAAGYLNDTFYQKLKIQEPLNNQAIRLVSLKGEQSPLQRKFDKTLQKLKRSKTYQKLLDKWNLTVRD